MLARGDEVCLDHPMYSRTAAAQLAARVRSLIGPQNASSLTSVSSDLGVAEGDLREIVMHETRYPSASVLAAIVAFHGVDAGWLLTGNYSPPLHRATAADEGRPKTVVAQLLREVERRD